MACTKCSPPAQKVWIFSCGVFFLLCALVIGLVWPVLVSNILYKELALKENSTNYVNWLETPLPMYLSVTLFNWTNSADVHNHNVKPNFVEMGPYVFSESHKRVDLEWFDNNTIAYNQTRTWHFKPDMSNGTLDDVVTNLNVITASVAYAMRHQPNVFKIVANYMLNHKGGSLFVSKTVRELLYDGYDDQLLTFLRGLNSTAFLIPYNKFGWFVDRNESSSYDGRMSIHTGVDDMSKLGFVDRWNGLKHTPFYHDGCSMMNGTTGELWPPKMNPTAPVNVFATDFCRSVKLTYESDVERFGVKGSKWIGDQTVFDNGENYPPNKCFCTGEPSSCPDLMSGVLNVSDCRYQAPVFVSFPHFYLADESYLDAIEGMHPTKEEHEFYMALDPNSGIPLEVKAQAQINMLLQPISGINIYSNVPKVMVPMFWFRQSALLTESLADSARLIQNLPSYGIYGAAGIASIGLILFLGGIFLCLRQIYRAQPVDNELLR